MAFPSIKGRYIIVDKQKARLINKKLFLLKLSNFSAKGRLGRNFQTVQDCPEIGKTFI